MRKTIVTCDRCGGSSGMTEHSKPVIINVTGMSIAGGGRFTEKAYDLCPACQVLLRDFFDPQRAAGEPVGAEKQGSVVVYSGYEIAVMVRETPMNECRAIISEIGSTEILKEFCGFDEKGVLNNATAWINRRLTPAYDFGNGSVVPLTVDRPNYD